jgi:hypothetical protein
MKFTKLLVIMTLLVALVATCALGAGITKKTNRTEAGSIKVGELERSQLEKSRSTSALLKGGQDEGVVPQMRPTQFFKVPKNTQKSLDAPIAAGTYTIPGNYASINLAVLALNMRGISGPVVFSLTSATYNEAGFYIAPVVGSDNVNTVTFKPAITGVTVNLVANTIYGGGWTFAGASNVIIDGSVTTGTRDLTVQYDQTQTYSSTPAYGAVINLLPGTDSITIKNCVIKSMLDPAGAGGRYNITVQGDATVSASYITVDNCEMTQSARNIVVYTNIASSGPVTGNMGRYWNITNNYIHDVLDFGMYLSMIYYCNVTGNTITDVRTLVTEGSQRTAGIYMAGFYNLIQNNKISNVLNQKAAASSSSNVAFGIHNRFPVAFAAAEGLSGVFAGYNENDPWLVGWAGYSTKNRFIQNTISEVRSNVTAANWRGVVGLACWGGRYDSVLHNTISFDGAAGAGGAMGLYFQGSGWHSFRLFSNNNIISMNRVTGNTNSPLFTWNVFDDYRFPSDYNVYYHPYGIVMDGGKPQANCANLYNDYGYATDGHSLDLNPYLMGGNDLHLDGTQASAADGNGSWTTGTAGFYHVPNDLDNVPRATPPDIGAYEGTSTGTQVDVGLLSLDSPGPAGAPDGLVFSPITVTAQNFGYTNVTGVVVEVKIYNPLAELVYTDNVTVDIDAFASVSADMALSWTPAGPGGYTFTCTATLAGDVNAANDQISPIIPVAGMKSVPYITGFETAGERDGWFGNNDWGIAQPSLGHTKLGGQNTAGGDYSYQTVPGPAGTHYSEVMLNDLYSPYFDLSSVTDAYLSFYHSIDLEPEWDRSIMEYSIDTGKTWNKLGALNEPSPAVNWYSTAVYQNAAGANGNDCYDEADSPRPLLGEPGFWSSNGDCMGDDIPTGPVGFIFVQIKVPDDAIGKTYVRFRYAAWSDYTSYDGWAFDDFALTATPQDFPPVTITGKVVVDTDGSGTVNVGDAPMTSTQVDIQYFGVHMEYATTDVNGDYSYDMTLPGDYVIFAQPDGYITDFPAVGYQTVSYADAVTSGKDIANYVGKISGTKWHDVDNDGVKDAGEPGLAGWTIELHKDSANGDLALYGSTVTEADGSYEFNVQPYNGWYVVSEVAQSTARQTYPAGAGTWPTEMVYGASGTWDLQNRNFGNFVLAILRTECSVDWAGLGQLPPKGYDHAALPLGTPTLNFEFYKNNVLVATDALSNGVSIASHVNLDLGTYKFKRVSTTPAGWIFTTLDSIEIVITTGGIVDSATFMYFKPPTVTGTKYNDLNGNGAKDEGEPGLVNWAITLTGNGGGTVMTDANGNYSFPAVGTGSHGISETPQDGWMQTTAAVANWTAFSGSYAQNNKVINFGNFQKICISGTKFRDRDNFGVMDLNEEGLANWDITLTLNATVLHAFTGSDGSFSFCDLGPGTYTLGEVLQANWQNTLPSGGTYTIPAVSGTNVTGQLFGNFFNNDTTKYRTFTYEQLQPLTEKKALKAPKTKAGSPWWAPNTANLIETILKTELGTMQVGVIGSKAPNGKDYAYLKPVKQADVFKTFNDGKGAFHLVSTGGLNRGLDFDKKGGAMYKQYKSIPATKKNDPLLAQLLTLQVNLEASDKGHTPAGIGALVYTWPNGGMWTGNKSIDDIAAFADNIMTNWGGVNYWQYDSLYNIVTRINEAFANTVITDTTTDGKGGWRAIPLKFIWKAYKTASQIAFLKAAPGVTPRERPVGTPELIPSVYALNQNYPNPFNPTTMLSFDLPEASIVTLTIYNVLGQEVATVLNHQEFSEGLQEVEFDASTLASGVYLYRIAAEQITDEGVGQTFMQVKKMLLMK